MLTVYQLKPRFQALLRPQVARLAAAGVTANQVTIAAAAGSFAIGVLVAWLAEYRPLFILIALWMPARMALNAIDGMLAREFGQKSRLGAYLNELCDVVADAALYFPFAAIWPFGPASVVTVIVLAMTSEYAGALGPMIGVERQYQGPMGKSDRATVFGLLAFWVAVTRSAARLAVVADAASSPRCWSGRSSTASAPVSAAEAWHDPSPLDRPAPDRERRYRARAGDHRRAGQLAGHAARSALAHLFRQPPQPWRFRADLDRVAADAAPPDAAGRRGGLLGAWRSAAFSAESVFDAVLVEREAASRDKDPTLPLLAALDAGASLILFPEGTRNTTEAPLLPFKSGLYRLARSRPEIELVPVWIENLNRVMPKGEFVPVPLLCTVTFGAPLALGDGEGSMPFRERSRAALLASRSRRAPQYDRRHEPRRRNPGAVRRHRRGAGRRFAGRLCRWRAASPRPNPTIDNLNARLRAWWVMVALIGARLRVRQARRDPAVRARLVRRAARIRHPDPDPARRSLGACRRRSLSCCRSSIIWSGIDGTGSSRSSSRSMCSCCCRSLRRCAATPRDFMTAHRRAAMGADDLRCSACRTFRRC